MDANIIKFTDGIFEVGNLENNSVHLILSDIPYGIGIDTWDVIHANTNTAFLGTSPAQIKAGCVFKKRGKPLNGWSAADKKMPQEYYEWCLSWTKKWFNVLVPGGNVFVFAGRRFAHRCIAAMEDSGFTFKDMLGWNKINAPHRAQRISIVYERRHDFVSADKWTGWRVGNLRPVFEPILWFTKPYRLGGTLADNIKEFGTGAYNEAILEKYNQSSDNFFQIKSSTNDSGLHPTQKPLKLMELLIELTTKEGQIVLDPFCGSGTTLVAALKLKRMYIGYENNFKFYSTAKDRLNKAEAEINAFLF